MSNTIYIHDDIIINEVIIIIILCLYIQASTTLVSMNEEDIVAKNVKAALNSLTDHEAQVRDHIMQKYFVPLGLKHWEGVEVAEYKEEMKRIID